MRGSTEQPLSGFLFVAMLTAHSALTTPDAPASIVLALGDTCTSLRPTRPVSRRRRHRLLPSLSAAAAVPSSRALLMTMPSPILPALLGPLRLSPTRDLLIVALAVEPHVQGPTLPQRLSLLACRQIRRDKKTRLHAFTWLQAARTVAEDQRFV